MLGVILSRKYAMISQAITICYLQRVERSLVLNGVVGILPVILFPLDGCTPLSFTTQDLLLFIAPDLLFHTTFYLLESRAPYL